MRREIVLPTPLHAADLQFQAFAEFDGSAALADIRCPTLVLTGDLDELIPPQNSLMLARLIRGAELVVMPGRGHRVLWESTEACVDLIMRFLQTVHGDAVAPPHSQIERKAAPNPLTTAIELFTAWPLALAKAGLDALTIARQSIMVGGSSRFGDGKPIILVPQLLGSDLALVPFSMWLKALGYRPVTAGLFVHLEEAASDRSLSQAICDLTARVGRKAVLITHSSGMARALRIAEAHRGRISDLVVFEAPHRPRREGLRIHFLSSGWSVLHGMFELPALLRGIRIELIEQSGPHAEAPRDGILAGAEKTET